MMGETRQAVAWAKERGIKYLLVSFVEMNGASRAKLVPAQFLENVAEEGAGFAGFAAGDLGQGPNDPDLVAIPDFKAAFVLPWQPDIAWVASNLHVNGEQWPYCPRTIASNYLAAARQRGYSLYVGMEPEFFLLRRNPDGSVAPFDPQDTQAKPCYNQQALTRNLDLISRMVGYMNDLGWGVYQCDHEDANCQFEINWGYSEALAQADRLVFAKYLIRTIAEQHGFQATFMPKPFKNLTGNGCHYHMSLWDAEGRQNLFSDRSDPNGLSKLGYYFMGGLMKHARALSAITAPTVNSYKRLVTRPTLSGATWAPVYITYGGNNRTVMLRIPAGGRIENRTIDGAANPYLAITAIMAAGLDGIENKIDPGQRCDLNTYAFTVQELQERGLKVLPANLAEALEELEQDSVIRNALGQEYSSYYLKVKQQEWDEYHNTVSQWELDRYLTGY